MTREEKNAIVNFLDIAEDYSKSGYRTRREDYSFTDDPADAESFESGLPGSETPDDGLDIPFFLQKKENEEENRDSLELIADEIKACSACPLSRGRTQAVPGEGAREPLVMVIGEGPGRDEDESGRPFVGKAGQLLDRMLASIGLSRAENCFIANVVKCRPPHNRDPEPEESAACASFLSRQIALLKPKAILALGKVATQNLLQSTASMGSLRGRFARYGKEGGIPLLPSYHPSALLRDESLKRLAWEDLKTLRNALAETDENYGREQAERD